MKTIKSKKNLRVKIKRLKEKLTAVVLVFGVLELSLVGSIPNFSSPADQAQPVKQSLGVLAFNTNKSVYTPGETAHFSFAVLDEQGEPVCDASITLIIKNKSAGWWRKNQTKLSTGKGEIQVLPECQSKEATEFPDYEAQYTVENIGKYEMELTATTPGGQLSRQDSFEVADRVPFVVERQAATRIYPQNTYRMRLMITAQQDFTGTVEESLPEDFSITPLVENSYFVASKTTHQRQLIKWNLALKAGETINLFYNFATPKKSPNFYLVGPLTLKENQQVSFAEARLWQLAIDTKVSVGTSTAALALRATFQRKTFYDDQNGKYWIFLYSGNDIDIYYSTDGSSWSADTSLAYNTDQFSVWWGTSGATEYVWIAHLCSTYDTCVRRGSLGASSISWDASTYTVLDGTSTSNRYQYPYITRDSSGYLWVNSRYSDGTNTSVKTIDSTNPDDPQTWNSVTTPSGTTTTAFALGTMVPLDNQDMYIAYDLAGAMKGCFWDDSDGAWEDSSGNSCANGANVDSIGVGVQAIARLFQAVVDTTDYDVHLLYIENLATDSVAYVRWDNSTGINGTWGSEVSLDSSNTDVVPSISIDSSNNDLYAFWSDTSVYDIFYRKCDVSAATGNPACTTSGDWATEVTWQNNTTTDWLGTNYSASGKIWGVWTEGTASPYTIYWDKLNMAPTAPSSLYTNETASGAQSGATDATAVGDTTPVFSTIYNDPDSGDIANKYEIIAYSNSGCSTQVWDSGSSGTAMTNCTQGNRCGDIDFGGTALSFDGTQYWWKIRYWDDDGAAGDFSGCTDNFTILGPADQMRHGNYFFNKSTERVFTW